jgi:RHS repeat-associated protein
VGPYEQRSNGDILHYISGPDGLCALLVTNTAGTRRDIYYTYTDYQGSLIAAAKPDGSIIEFSYDAWGRRRQAADWTNYTVTADALGAGGTQLFTRGYTGHELIDAFGLINMNGRMYDPRLGRFLSPDNVVQSPTNSQNYNRYSYCLNNPLKYTDPTGWDYYDPWGLFDYDVYQESEDPNDPSTNWGQNWFGYSYPGGNNPEYEYTHHEFYGHFNEMTPVDFPAIQHDQEYDKLGDVGALSLFTDPRAEGYDKQFVLQESIVGTECLFNAVGDWFMGITGHNVGSGVYDNLRYAAGAYTFALGLEIASSFKEPLAIVYFGSKGAAQYNNYLVNELDKGPKIFHVLAEPFKLERFEFTEIEKLSVFTGQFIGGGEISSGKQFFKWSGNEYMHANYWASGESTQFFKWAGGGVNHFENQATNKVYQFCHWLDSFF